MPEEFKITNRSKGKLPRLPFDNMKNAILGPKYALSFVVVTKNEIHDLNLKYRKKDEPTDILSFALDRKTGEIFIAPAVAKKKALIYKVPFKKFMAVLFIHGLLHLKGMDHGSKMETLERRFVKKFGF